MDREVEAFVRFCRFERRLAEQTCRASEPDVGACLRYIRSQGVESWSEVRPPDLREFLADEAAPAGGVQSGPDGRRAQRLLPLLSRVGVARPRPGHGAADAQEA
jgi:site-specific recombinase XerD